MKKLLIVAALLATSAVPATPVYAKDMAMPAPSKAICLVLPLLPDCIAMIKEMAPPPPAAPKIAMPVVTAPAMPMMPMMPNCTKAPAGSGHLFDCAM